MDVAVLLDSVPEKTSLRSPRKLLLHFCVVPSDGPTAEVLCLKSAR